MGDGQMRRITIAATVLVLAALAFSAAAFAGGALKTGYGGAAAPAAVATKHSAGQKKPAVLPKTVHASTLPFTGMDLAWVALGGGALVVLGLGLHRVARNES
jgi:hypothetical protein